MTLMLSELRSALIEAGASPGSADKAAIEAAGYDTRLTDIARDITEVRGEIRLLKWAQGVTLGGVLAILFKLFLH